MGPGSVDWSLFAFRSSAREKRLLGFGDVGAGHLRNRFARAICRRRRLFAVQPSFLFFFPFLLPGQLFVSLGALESPVIFGQRVSLLLAVRYHITEYRGGLPESRMQALGDEGLSRKPVTIHRRPGIRRDPTLRANSAGMPPRRNLRGFSEATILFASRRRYSKKKMDARPPISSPIGPWPRPHNQASRPGPS